jgi:sodium pump decarboxylase gamma subunit
MSALMQAGMNVTAIGLSVVFILLTLLVFIIKGMSALSMKLEAKFGVMPEAASSTAPSHAHELVSVISAAVAAYRKDH